MPKRLAYHPSPISKPASQLFVTFMSCLFSSLITLVGVPLLLCLFPRCLRPPFVELLLSLSMRILSNSRMHQVSRMMVSYQSNRHYRHLPRLLLYQLRVLSICFFFIPACLYLPMYGTYVCSIHHTFSSMSIFIFFSFRSSFHYHH